MHVTMLFASTLGKIFQPFFDAMAWVIAAFYAVVPNYALAIALLTIAVMAISAPLTIKSTRSMSAMSRLQGPMKELQKKYKNDKVKLNEEMMKLYREHGVNPAAGCVPLLIQFPVFIVLYDVIEGLTNTVTKNHHVIAEPRYIGHHTALYHNLILHPGVMSSFGVNLAHTVFSSGSLVQRIPFVVLIIVAIGLQYLQMHQMTKRNGNNAMNAQMQSMQKFMPLIFAVIYIRISAGVNVYFIVSALCRIGLQMWSFRTMPAAEPARVGTVTGGKAPRKTLMERLGEAQQRALEQKSAQQAMSLQPGARRPTSGRGGPGAAPGAKPTRRPPTKGPAPGAKPTPRPGIDAAGSRSEGVKRRPPTSAQGSGETRGRPPAPPGAKPTRRPPTKGPAPGAKPTRRPAVEGNGSAAVRARRPRPLDGSAPATPARSSAPGEVTRSAGASDSAETSDPRVNGSPGDRADATGAGPEGPTSRSKQASKQTRKAP